MRRGGSEARAKRCAEPRWRETIARCGALGRRMGQACFAGAFRTACGTASARYVLCFIHIRGGTVCDGSRYCGAGPAGAHVMGDKGRMGTTSARGSMQRALNLGCKRDSEDLGIYVFQGVLRDTIHTFHTRC